MIGNFIWPTILGYAAGFGSHQVADKIGEVVNFVGVALAISVGSLVVSLTVMALVSRRKTG
jgi:hypothetical protein